MLVEYVAHYFKYIYTEKKKKTQFLVGETFHFFGINSKLKAVINQFTILIISISFAECRHDSINYSSKTLFDEF